jgi:hypothetical protein
LRIFLQHPLLDLMIKLFIYDELKKGEFFIKEGQYAKEIAFLETGIVRAFYINKKGQEYNKHFFVAPSIIGSYASLISKQENEVPPKSTIKINKKTVGAL